MLNKLAEWTVRLNQRSFIKITRQTLMLLFPIAYVGTLAVMLKRAFFAPDSFFYNIADLGDIIPDWLWTGITGLTGGLAKIAFGMFGVMAAYAAARYTAKLYHQDAPMAGMTGFATMLLLAFRYTRTSSPNMISFDWNLLSVRSVLFALIVGYGIGQVYRWLGKGGEPGDQTIETLEKMQQRALNAIRPLFFSLAVGAALGALFNWLTLSSWLELAYTWLENFGQGNQSLWVAIPLIAVSLLMSWLGIGGPTINTAAQGLTGAAAANLNYALQHGSSWNVPYKYLAATLYSSFANFGGDGVMLALVIALIIVGRQPEIQRLARWNLLPTLFNSSYSLMTGLPVILNPVFLLPYLLLPLANLLLSALATLMHLIPATPYPLPMGTPGPLAAFIGSNGDWEALLFSLVLLIFDVWAYIPFVRLALGAELKTQQIEAVHNADY
ncbi:PTS transporter subunit EIIC [Limosilactobacillus mucosae]|uniref:PTS transporter subunit EIIC n=1 Tax=Limosilactobacillus mucosae TaxID=97478 RepID=UPI0039936BD4